MDHISTTNNIDLFSNSSDRHVVVNGPLIIGAGPSGLAVAACLKDQGVPYIILDRADCIASLWQNRTYNRLKLHLPKQFCQLPKLSFPESFPKYPTKSQFISYLETYAQRFDIQARFNQCVRFAKLEESLQLWRVRTGSTKVGLEEEIEYLCRWLVVASGENAECVVPDIDGMADFDGKVIHSSEYRTGDDFRGQKVLVVGCGNSGMELSLDLANHHALPSLVCRSSVHVLPREIMGRSTFELAMTLLKWIPLLLVDKILLIFTWLMLGNIEKIGLKRPKMGPIELKNKHGKSPVLDIGALAKIRSGHIKIVPGIKKFVQNGVELVHGDNIEVDSVILATGYRSNVPYWLQDGDFFDKNGFPKSPFSNGWKGKDGLYAAGFTRRGLSGASFDAIRIAQDIGMLWKDETKHNKLNKAYLRRCISSF